MLGIIIKQYRKMKEMSIREFAKKVGCSYTYIGLLERGRPFLPSVTLLKNIAKEIGMPFDDLAKLSYAEEKGYFKTYLSKGEKEDRLNEVNYD